jgi:hypothetical protein
MKIKLTRDSVAAGDDVDAPHLKEFEVSGNLTTSSILQQILSMNYLANISGGNATWSLASTKPLALIAQQWPEPKLLAWTNPILSELSNGNEELSLRFNYHAQSDPEVVYKVLSRFKLCNS